MRRALLGGLAAVALSCQPQKPAATGLANVPQMRATVVTIRTTTAPARKTFLHALVIANGKARFGNEVDRWRLFDFRNKRVVFVDELSKSYRAAAFETLVEQKRKSLEASPAGTMPRATIEQTANAQQIAGVTARQYVIRMGRYERQLWIGDHPSIPSSLFAMMTASQPDSTPIASVDREPLTEILGMSGFPLIDRSELPYDAKNNLAIERTVVKIEDKNVPAGWLDIPAGFKDTTPAPTTAPSLTNTLKLEVRRRIQK